MSALQRRRRFKAIVGHENHFCLYLFFCVPQLHHYVRGDNNEKVWKTQF